MNKLLLIALVLSAVVFGAILIGCSSTGSDSNATTVAAFADYASWNKVNAEPITGDRTGVLRLAHSGERGFREVYINDVGKSVSDGKADLPYPAGTIIVKESYSGKGGKKGALASITVMVKREPGYDTDNSDWEYVNVRPSMRIRAQGPLNICINCHAIAGGDDYVFTSNR